MTGAMRSGVADRARPISSGTRHAPKAKNSAPRAAATAPGLFFAFPTLPFTGTPSYDRNIATRDCANTTPRGAMRRSRPRRSIALSRSTRSRSLSAAEVPTNGALRAKRKAPQSARDPSRARPHKRERRDPGGSAKASSNEAPARRWRAWMKESLLASATGATRFR